MRKRLVVCCALMVALVLGLASCTSLESPGSTRIPFDWVPTPIPSRQIADQTLGLREYWRLSQSHIGGYRAPLLSAIDERVIYLRFNLEDWTNQIQVSDGAGGELLSESDTLRALDLTVDAERAYVKSEDTILAYDLDTGQRLWEYPVEWHMGHNLYLEGDALAVHCVQTSQIHYLDVHTGEEIGLVSLEATDELMLFGRFPEFDLYRTPRMLRAVDITSRQTLWETRVLGIWFIYERPLLSDNVVVIRMLGGVIVLDARTGAILWENETPFASNAIVQDGSLYALDYDARLVRLDLETGQETGYLQFTPSQTYADQQRYWVAADGQMLYVSFTDSEELIALGP